LAGVFAGAASAKNYTPKQKAQIRKQLRRQIKANPRVVLRSGFLKKASLVNFTLPVTIRVRQATDNAGGRTENLGSVNTATLDLGPSLGTRTIGLGGSLPAEIRFHDSYDGGALGNVDLNLLAGGAGLTTTSIPLLSNPDVSGKLMADGGCSNFAGATGPQGTTDQDLVSNLSFANNNPGVNSIGTGDPQLGTLRQDAVLRTNTLTLKIDGSNATVSAASLGLPDGTIPTTTVGKSGGQANLFGDIPGRHTQVDVTASLITDINSILREVDGATPPATAGNNAALFNCRQAWTGTVTNHLPGIHLNGSLKISPAITADGKLRIAKATLASPGAPATPESDPVAVAACLMPETAFVTETPGSPLGPINPFVRSTAPTDACNTVVSTIMSGVLHVQPLNNPLAPPAPYTTTNNGARVAVAGGITVNNLAADVLIGANQG
jgi:hypothetical protein